MIRCWRGGEHRQLCGEDLGPGLDALPHLHQLAQLGRVNLLVLRRDQHRRRARQVQLRPRHLRRGQVAIEDVENAGAARAARDEDL